MATAKAAAKKAAEPEYDFDSWDEAAEEAAIESLAPKVQYIIVEGDFVGRFSDGAIMRLSLTNLTVDDIDELDEVSPSPVDQIKHLLTKLGEEKAAKEFTSHGITEAIALASKYFEVLNRVAGASLGE